MLSKPRSYANQVARHYLKRHGVYSAIDKARKQVGFIGCSLVDYAHLYYFVKKTRPQFFLECGTGLSTYVIAKAMKDHCYDFYGGNIKLISMEEDKDWYGRAVEIFPNEYKEFVEIKLSATMMYLFIYLQGVSYKDIPKYPYDTVFVDGPLVKNVAISMDYLRLLACSRIPISAIIDGRILTVLAYQSLLGKKRIARFGDFHIVKPTSQYDLFVTEKDQQEGGNVTAHARKLIGEATGKQCDAAVEWNI